MAARSARRPEAEATDQFELAGSSAGDIRDHITQLTADLVVLHLYFSPNQGLPICSSVQVRELKVK